MDGGWSRPPSEKVTDFLKGTSLCFHTRLVFEESLLVFVAKVLDGARQIPFAVEE